MRVRTLRSHGNAYGAGWAKAAGDVYEHPDPQHLVDAGLVEAADPLDHDSNGRKGGSLPRRKPGKFDMIETPGGQDKAETPEG